MANGYPPGITGNEPEITGEIVVDPHNPFWVGEDPDRRRGYAVFFGASADHWWGGFVLDEAKGRAQLLADQLNARWSLRDPQPDPKTGQCLVCGDFHDGGLDAAS